MCSLYIAACVALALVAPTIIQGRPTTTDQPDHNRTTIAQSYDSNTTTCTQYFTGGQTERQVGLTTVYRNDDKHPRVSRTASRQKVTFVLEHINRAIELLKV